MLRTCPSRSTTGCMKWGRRDSTLGMTASRTSSSFHPINTLIAHLWWWQISRAHRRRSSPSILSSHRYSCGHKRWRETSPFKSTCTRTLLRGRKSRKWLYRGCRQTFRREFRSYLRTSLVRPLRSTWYRSLLEKSYSSGKLCSSMRRVWIMKRWIRTLSKRCYSAWASSMFTLSKRLKQKLKLVQRIFC